MKIGYFILSMVLLGSLSTQAKNDEGNTRIKEQTEAGFNLSDQAAEQILKRYKFQPEERTDYYVDIYDGHEFLLIPSPEMYKFRLKAYDKKWILQANTKLLIQPGGCSNGATFKMKKKRVGELLLDKKQKKQFTGEIVEILDLLPNVETEEGVRRLRGFHEFILGLNLPLLSTLMSVPRVSNWYFTPSHQTHKIKWILEQNMGFGKVVVSIAHGDDHVGSTFIQEKYEIEFQIEDPMTLEQFSQSICSFMEAQNLAPEDYHPPRAKAQLETLTRLQRFNQALGLQ